MTKTQHLIHIRTWATLIMSRCGQDIPWQSQFLLTLTWQPWRDKRYHTRWISVPQKTNQIFTPKWVVKKMVDLLEQENPHIFEDPKKTFADLYMKSGLYITEIVRRLYNNKEDSKNIVYKQQKLEIINFYCLRTINRLPNFGQFDSAYHFLLCSSGIKLW